MYIIVHGTWSENSVNTWIALPELYKYLLVSEDLKDERGQNSWLLSRTEINAPPVNDLSFDTTSSLEP